MIEMIDVFESCSCNAATVMLSLPLLFHTFIIVPESVSCKRIRLDNLIFYLPENIVQNITVDILMEIA